MERVLRLAVKAPVVSFRRPLDHNYQRTLPMPPPTTLIGLAGAALGLPDYEIWNEKSPLRNVKVAVLMENLPGRARDMWTLLKIKGNKMERSPYMRELMFFASYTIFYGGEEALLKKLEKAFYDPSFPLSLGREDELILIDEISIEIVSDGTQFFSGTVIPGDIRKMKVRPVIGPGISIEPPVVETVPLSFVVDKRRIRHSLDSAILSFLPMGIDYEVKSPFLPALQYRGRNFTWMNF